jgi:hypothetical protein
MNLLTAARGQVVATEIAPWDVAAEETAGHRARALSRSAQVITAASVPSLSQTYIASHDRIVDE